MPLPLIADSLDKIPEAARGAYAAKDGKFVLDAEIEDVSGLKTTNEKLKKEKQALSDRVKLLGDRPAEEIQADLEFAAKAREQKLNGNVDELKAAHAKELAKATTEKGKVEAKLFDVLGKREAEKEIAALGIKTKVLLPHVLPHIKVVEVNGEYEAQVVDAKGVQRVKDGQGTPVTIAELVAEIAADPEFDGVVPASSARGSGARNGAGSGSGGAVVIIPRNADTATYQRMKADAEKRGVPYKVGA